MAIACDIGHPDQTKLPAAIVAGPAFSKSSKTLQARATQAGRAPTESPGGFVLSRWSHYKHCPDLTTFESWLQRMGVKS